MAILTSTCPPNLQDRNVDGKAAARVAKDVAAHSAVVLVKGAVRGRKKENRLTFRVSMSKRTPHLRQCVTLSSATQ